MKTLLPGWYVVYTKSRFEKKTTDKLIEHQFKVYLPLVTTISQWSDRKKKVKKPLFNSYIFIYLETGKDYFEVLSIHGVVSFIKLETNPVRVPEEEINRIKIFLNEFHDVELKNTKDLKVGDKRKITSGPFENYECEIIRIDNKNKICIRINSLQQSLLAEIHPYHLI